MIETPRSIVADMAPRLEIASRVLHAIRAEAAASRHEICGLLFGDGRSIAAHRPCRNIAADPARTFEIDPAALIAAHRAQRAGGPAIAGCYHSHPSGRAEPSRLDAAAAAADGWLWLIAAGDEVRGWRAVAHGERHGRFDPVDLRPLA